jgi:hypothetical protein
MYRIVRASILYYDAYMKGAGTRHVLVKPYTLWIHRERFIAEKAQKTEAYANLCDIVDRMKRMYETGKPQFHHFGMLLEELQVLGFETQSMEPLHVTDPDKLREQLDLLLQFLASRYPFDAYDNHIGIHDLRTRTFVFEQP